MTDIPKYRTPIIIFANKNENCYFKQQEIKEEFNNLKIPKPYPEKFIVEMPYLNKSDRDMIDVLSVTDFLLGHTNSADWHKRYVPIIEPGIELIQVIFTRIKHQVVNELQNFTTNVFPFYIIWNMSLQIRSKDELSNPKTTPKFKVATCIYCADKGKLKKKKIVLDIDLEKKRFTWKSAPFRAINDQEMIEKIIRYLETTK